ncbi:MAG: four helix bundle protein [Bryobacterales bacterium]|nr:four helix bundle protein [Bryobacterales bacterium]
MSIPANIAEGFRRRGKADKARFLNIAAGSVEEAGSLARTPPPF